MHKLSVIALVTIIPIVAALKCHQTSYQMSIDQPITTVATDCPYGSYTCLKAVEMSTRMYTKQCGYNNCTNPSLPGYVNQPAACYNASTSITCCCYGDGCNPASKTSFAIGGLAMVGFYFF